MIRRSTDVVLDDSAEQLVAELAVAAHAVALRHGKHESFVDLQLALWEALRSVVKQEAEVAVREGAWACCVA